MGRKKVAGSAELGSYTHAEQQLHKWEILSHIHNPG
jgi:hypothetical protein